MEADPAAVAEAEAGPGAFKVLNAREEAGANGSGPDDREGIHGEAKPEQVGAASTDIPPAEVLEIARSPPPPKDMALYVSACIKLGAALWEVCEKE